MLFPEHMLAVRATVQAEHEDEFNRWYDDEHVPDALSMFPGCVEAARYRVIDGDGSHQYIAMYAFRSADELAVAMAGDALQEMIRRYDAAIGAFSTRTRTTYMRISHLDKGS